MTHTNAHNASEHASGLMHTKVHNASEHARTHTNAHNASEHTRRHCTDIVEKLDLEAVLALELSLYRALLPGERIAAGCTLL